MSADARTEPFTESAGPARRPDSSQPSAHPTHTMREITRHQVPEALSALRILVLDEPGPGGACHSYEIIGFTNDPLLIEFQKGPLKEAGTNGITHEALLAILLDRIDSFQAGPFPCLENGDAQDFLGAALRVLHLRTARRARSGEEGRNVETGGLHPEYPRREGIDAICLERKSHATKGYTLEHDDGETLAELVTAALSYASVAQCQALAIAADEEFQMSPEPAASWPWAREDWHPSADPKRNLEIAGALLAAEWDRLSRAEQERRRFETPPVDNAHVAEGCEQFAEPPPQEMSDLLQGRPEQQSSSSAADRGESTLTETPEPERAPDKGHELGGESGEGMPAANEIDATGAQEEEA